MADRCVDERAQRPDELVDAVLRPQLLEADEQVIDTASSHATGYRTAFLLAAGVMVAAAAGVLALIRPQRGARRLGLDPRSRYEEFDPAGRAGERGAPRTTVAGAPPGSRSWWGSRRHPVNAPWD